MFVIICLLFLLRESKESSAENWTKFSPRELLHSLVESLSTNRTGMGAWAADRMASKALLISAGR